VNGDDEGFRTRARRMNDTANTVAVGERGRGEHSTERTFVARDGTRIAYTVAGEGSAFVLTNGLTTTTTFWKYVRPIWLRNHTVITWDLPGHGQSGPAQSAATARVEAQPELMIGILDALDVKRAVHVGWSTGCQLVLEAYRQFPARCARLALLFGPAGRVLETTRLPRLGPLFERCVRVAPPAAFEVLCALVSRALLAPGSIPLGRKLQLIGEHTRESDVRQVLEHIGTVHPRTLREMLLSLQSHSAQSLLPHLRVRLLILAGDEDPFAPSELVGVPMSAAASGSELVRLPHGTHTALLDEPAWIARVVEEFAART
jgi:pimeloyl-ACP methyl ester carboxylesterase